MVKEVDHKGIGAIDYEEFLTMMNSISLKKWNYQNKKNNKIAIIN